MRLSKPCQAKSWKSTSRQNSSLLQTAHPNVTLLPPWIFCFIAPDRNSLNQLVLLNPCCISRHTCKGNTSIFSPFRSFMENMVNRSVVWVACSIESTTLKLHVTFRNWWKFRNTQTCLQAQKGWQPFQAQTVGGNLHFMSHHSKFITFTVGEKKSMKYFYYN